jgi:hypothetical protein
MIIIRSIMQSLAKTEFLGVEICGKYSYHWSLKG